MGSIELFNLTLTLLLIFIIPSRPKVFGFLFIKKSDQ